MLTQYYYLFFGLVAIVGGALGDARAKSIPSVVAYFLPSYLRKRKAMPAIPMILLSLLCIALTAVHWFK